MREIEWKIKYEGSCTFQQWFFGRVDIGLRMLTQKFIV